MATQKIDIHTVEQWNELFNDDPHANARVQQLSRGDLQYHSVVGDFGKIHFEWDWFGAKVRRRDVSCSGGTLIGFPIEAPQALKLFGESMGYGDSYLIQPGVEADHIVAKGTREIWFVLPPDILEQMCVVPSRAFIKRISQAHLRKLIATCREALHCPGDWQTQILADLYNVIEPWRDVKSDQRHSKTTSRHFYLFSQAESLLPDVASGKAAETNQIAKTLGVSRRTIFQAFQSSIGMPPATYLRLKRLHALRELLSVTPRGSRTITALATSTGFRHLGRMHVDYRKQFGETPRSTLQR